MSNVTSVTYEIECELNKISATRYKVTPWKQRKKSSSIKFFVHDGIIPFTVSISDMKCNCNKYMCSHKLFVFYYHIGLDAFGIFMMQYDELRDKLIKMIIENKLKKDMIHAIWNDIYDWFDNIEECLICLEPQTHKDHNLQLTQCAQCKTFSHLKCVLKWEKTLKHNEDRGLCVKCRAKVQ